MVICFLFGSSAVVFMEPVILESVMYSNCVLTIVALLQARALISRLTEEKNNAIQQTSRLRQELVRIHYTYAIYFLFHHFIESAVFMDFQSE